MKRLLPFVCWFAAVSGLQARTPSGCFDLHYTAEYGKYAVEVETSAGPRRFVFDTGASISCISERLGRELGLVPVRQTDATDFEGHSLRVGYVRIPQLRMGEAVFSDTEVCVLPDSSYIFRCMDFDGIVGSDLLHGYVVRISNTDSTITLAGDIRQLGDFDRRKSVRLARGGKCPLFTVRLGNGRSRMKIRVKFDTGSPTLFDCRYGDWQSMLARRIPRRVRRTPGYSGHLGWTNRSEVREAVRGVVPCFELAGTRFCDMPFDVTYGRFGKIGCAILDWGTVLVDYPGHRLWLLPHTEEPVLSDTPLRSVAVALDGGRLIVGQVWDETLTELIAPGDRVVRVGSVDVSAVDPCAVIRGEIRGDTPELTVERRDGSLVCVPLRDL